MRRKDSAIPVDKVRKAGAIPVSAEELELVRQKHLDLMIRRGKALTLTQVSNEIIRKGLPLVD